jgi:hypothetical protein
MKSLENQLIVVQNMCLVLEAYHVSDEGKELLNSLSEFILIILDKSKNHFGLGEASQISLEMLRLKHLTLGLHLFEKNTDKSAESLKFGQHVCQVQCYNQDLQNETENILKKLQDKSSTACKDVNIKIQVPIQQVENFWVKCPDGHLNLARMPVTKKMVSCEFCILNINDVECPVFVKTDQKDNNIEIAKKQEPNNLEQPKNQNEKKKRNKKNNKNNNRRNKKFTKV